MLTKQEVRRVLDEIYYISEGYNIFSVVFDDITHNDETLCYELKRRDVEFRNLCKEVYSDNMNEELIIYRMIKKLVKNKHNKFLIENGM